MWWVCMEFQLRHCTLMITLWDRVKFFLPESQFFSKSITMKWHTCTCTTNNASYIFKEILVCQYFNQWPDKWFQLILLIQLKVLKYFPKYNIGNNIFYEPSHTHTWTSNIHVSISNQIQDSANTAWWQSCLFSPECLQIVHTQPNSEQFTLQIM